MSRSLTIALLTAILIAAPAHGQATGSIVGRVTESPSGNPVPAVVITARKTSDSTYVRSTQTGADGRFRLDVDVGRYELTARRIGYITRLLDVQLTAGAETTVDIALTAATLGTEIIVGVPMRSGLFTLYEPNYFITGTQGFYHGVGLGTTQSLNQVKFRVALRYKVISLGREPETGLHVAYRQNSFWHIYEGSAPFYESNYNPQAYLYWDSRERTDRSWIPSVKFTVQHESNGKDGTSSRGWNRYGLAGDFGDYFDDVVFGSLGVWRAFGVEPTNASIRDFAGRGQLSIALQPMARIRHPLRLGDLGLALNLRVGGKPFVPSTEINAFVSALALTRIPGFGWTRRLNASLMAQYFSGTGENLLNLTDRHRTFRFGMATVR